MVSLSTDWAAAPGDNVNAENYNSVLLRRGLIPGELVRKEDQLNTFVLTKQEAKRLGIATATVEVRPAFKIRVSAAVNAASGLFINC